MDFLLLLRRKPRPGKGKGPVEVIQGPVEVTQISRNRMLISRVTKPDSYQIPAAQEPVIW